MAERPTREAAEGVESPNALAERLEALTERLARRAEGTAEAATREELEACCDGLAALSGSLRGLSLLLDPERVEWLARGEAELKAILVAISESLRELATTNQRIGAKVGDRVRELDHIGDLPPGPELATRLSGVLAGVREATVEMEQHLDTMARELDQSNQRVATLERELDEARERALYDRLTEVYSRATLDEALQAAVARGERAGPWCFMLIDVDSFKAINDAFGHLVGDAFLIKVARVIEEALQASLQGASLARYGGDEFGILLPGAHLAVAAGTAERVRTRMACSRWQYSRDGEVQTLEATLSVGVVQFRPGDTVSSLVQRADRALYQAKEEGRDRVIVGGE